MKKKLPKSKMIRYCLSDIAKGLFNGMIGNYLLYFFQPTVKSGIPSLLPQNRFLGFLTVMALLTGLGKVIDAVTNPLIPLGIIVAVLLISDIAVRKLKWKDIKSLFGKGGAGGKAK